MLYNQVIGFHVNLQYVCRLPSKQGTTLNTETVTKTAHTQAQDHQNSKQVVCVSLARIILESQREENMTLGI